MAWLDGRSSARQEGLDQSLRAAVRHLKQRDPTLAGLIDRVGPCELHATTNAFQVMVETIVSQQLSVSAARSIYGRLAAAMNSRYPRPRDILALSHDQLIACGLSRSKAAFVRNVAEAFERDALSRRRFARMDDAAVMASLTAIKGVGDWSAHMFLIFALNRLDVFPVGDLGLRRALAAAYGLRRSAPYRRYERIGEVWRPYRTVGTLYAWRSYDGV